MRQDIASKKEMQTTAKPKLDIPEESFSSSLTPEEEERLQKLLQQDDITAEQLNLQASESDSIQPELESDEPANNGFAFVEKDLKRVEEIDKCAVSHLSN